MDSFLGDLEAYLRLELPMDWKEAQLNVSETPSEFPCWQVTYGGAEQRGNAWRPVAQVIVVGDFSQASGVAKELELRTHQVIRVIRPWLDGVVLSVGEMEILSLGGSYEYLGVRIRVGST